MGIVCVMPKHAPRQSPGAWWLWGVGIAGTVGLTGVATWVSTWQLS